MSRGGGGEERRERVNLESDEIGEAGPRIIMIPLYIVISQKVIEHICHKLRFCIRYIFLDISNYEFC